MNKYVPNFPQISKYFSTMCCRVMCRGVMCCGVMCRGVICHGIICRPPAEERIIKYKFCKIPFWLQLHEELQIPLPENSLYVLILDDCSECPSKSPGTFLLDSLDEFPHKLLSYVGIWRILILPIIGFLNFYGHFFIIENFQNSYHKIIYTG